MTTMHDISLTVGYEQHKGKWWVIRGHTAYSIPEGISVQDFVVLHAEDYHWEKCQEWDSLPVSRVFYTQMLHLDIQYDGAVVNQEFITRWWRSRGRGLVQFTNKAQWTDVMFIADWLRERVSEVEQECMMRILTKEAA